MNRFLLCTFVVSLTGIVAWAQGNEGYLLYEAAISNIESGEYQRAYKDFKDIQQNPQMTSYHPEALYWLVKIGIVIQLYPEVAYYADQFLSQFAYSDYYPEIRYHRARIYLFENQPEKCLELLENFIREYPSSNFIPSSYYWMGEALIRLERFESARNIFNNILQNYPLSVKREAALFRLKEIQLKNRENELLEMLKVSHANYLEVSAQIYLKGLEDDRIAQLEMARENESLREQELRNRLASVKTRIVELRKYYINELLRLSDVY